VRGAWTEQLRNDASIDLPVYRRPALALAPNTPPLVGVVQRRYTRAAKRSRLDPACAVSV